MKDRSSAASAAGSGHVVAREESRVDLLAQDDARIGAQPRVDLAGADVDRVHARGAALEQAVREPAGRRARRPDRRRPRDRSRTRRARPRASRRRARRTDARGRRRGSPASSATDVPALSTRFPSTSTRPARIIACAFSRVGARPRATSSRSRRDFTARRPISGSWKGDHHLHRPFGSRARANASAASRSGKRCVTRSPDGDASGLEQERSASASRRGRRSRTARADLAEVQVVAVEGERVVREPAS